MTKESKFVLFTVLQSAGNLSINDMISVASVMDKIVEGSDEKEGRKEDGTSYIYYENIQDGMPELTKKEKSVARNALINFKGWSPANKNQALELAEFFDIDIS